MYGKYRKIHESCGTATADAPSQDPPGGLARLRRCGALVLRSPQSQLFLERVAA